MVRAIDGIMTTDVKFKYALAKNRKALLNELEVLNEVSNPSAEFIAYDIERIELAKKMADKDEKGNAKIEGNAYVFTDQKEFDKELTKLRLKHKKVLEARDKQIKEFIDLLDKDSDFTPFKIKLENTPKEVSAAQLSGIIDLIQE